jgi:Possible hemagglutinin (DUF637)/Extended Signal Peptide of Type V secretion system
MNHHNHDLVFNRTRGCLMAVAETAKSSGKASGESSRPTAKQMRRKARFTWSLLSLKIAIAIGLQATLLLPLSHAAVTNQVGAVTSNKSETKTNSQNLSLVQNSSSGAGQVDQSTQYTSITGQTNIKANSVTVGMSVKDSAQALASQPGMGWITVLQNDPKLGSAIKWEAVQEAHQRWDYSQSGLSATGAALVSLAVAVATSGAGASLVGAAAGSASAAMASAAFTTLVTQATISLANNGGNLDKTLQQMGTNESLRSLATSVATAGALSEINQYLVVPAKPSQPL